MPIIETQPIRKNRYSKLLDLQLQGFQINLTSRPNTKSGKVRTKLSPRLNKLCPKRPMSASPAVCYQKSKNSKMPSWSRPQSAGCTRRNNKLAAKFPHQEIQETSYNSELGATYTLSSSQLLQSLMGSCSINTGLDSDSSHTPSPLPSLGETIRAVTHLEPGLASKPPLPPTQDLKIKDNENIDDIIAFKFQRWFPDSIIQSDKAKSLLDLRPYESKYNNDEITDDSDLGSRISLTDGETSDRDIKYLHKDSGYQSGKIKKQKNRSSSPIKRNDGSKNVRSSSKVKDLSRDNEIKSPSIVITNEVGLVQNKEAVPDAHIDFKSSLDSPKPIINDAIKDDVLGKFSFGETFYKNVLDNSNLKPDSSHPKCTMSNHSPPVKLLAENHNGNLQRNDYSSLLLGEINDNANQTMTKIIKEYPEHCRKVNGNSVNNGKSEGDKKHIFEQEDTFLFCSERSAPNKADSTKLLLDGFSQSNNFKTLTVETCNPTDINLKQNENVNKNGKLLITDEQTKHINWTGQNTDSNVVASSSAVTSIPKSSLLFGLTNDNFIMQSPSSDTKQIMEQPGGASYEDIVSILKVLETEELEPSILNARHVERLPVQTNMKDSHSSSAREILNFLDEVDRGSVVETFPLPDTSEVVNAAVSNSRFGELLNMNSADLAQMVMKLTLQVEEVTASHEALQNKHKHTLDLIKQQKEQEETTIRRNQKFIDQILNEKRQLAEQCEKIVKEMEEKHLNTVRNLEERNRVEMKKAQEKFATAEKSRRDRWIDLKTKKIKEMTVKGLEPELDRMTRIHQEEIAELRRVHQKQIEEIDTAWSRRLMTQREQDLAEREVAITHEREATRHRLELEVTELEKSYQEQRKRMLDEVRREREAMEKNVQSVMEQKQSDMEKEWQQMQQKLQDKMKEQEVQHQEEIKKLQQNLEAEKEAWMSRQNDELAEKEAVVKQELKRERDRHIEMIIRKLETEATTKEQAIDNKIKRLKETYENEIQELEGSLKELKHKLKEARAVAQKFEDSNSQTLAALHQAQDDCVKLKQTCSQLQDEKCSITAKNETKILSLQEELSSVTLSLQEEVSKVHEEKERQLQQVYTRVKEAITKKDEAVLIMQKQRDAALEQCSHLEKLLEQQRKNILQLKADKGQL